MIHYPHNEKIEETEKKYSKGIHGVIERFCEIVKMVIFILVFIIVTFSFYWLIHWIAFGRTVYKDLFYCVDKFSITIP